MINIKETSEIIQQLQKDDKKVLEIYKNTLDTVAFTTSIFINNILNDIKFIEKIKHGVKNSRYIYSILRVTTEQVIIYKFLMRKNVDNHSLCKDYLGQNIDIEKIEKSSKCEIELLKLLGGKRTKLYENIFKQMANKFEDVDDDTSLYNLYSIMADYVHNAYYKSLLSEIGKEDFNIEWVNTIILSLLTQFKESMPI